MTGALPAASHHANLPASDAGCRSRLVARRAGGVANRSIDDPAGPIGHDLMRGRLRIESDGLATGPRPHPSRGRAPPQKARFNPTLRLLSFWLLLLNMPV